MRDEIISIYSKSQKGGYAIGAFNFSTSEILRGILSAAIASRAPVIISNSEGERAFFGLDESVAMYRTLKKKHPALILHADHTKTFEEIKKVIDAGYPSVHFDGSELPYDKNVEQTKKVVDYAHKKGVFVEAELGGIRGGSTKHETSLSEVVKEELMTRPEQALDFVQKTGIDSLAVSIGNAHGLWPELKKLDFKRLEAIKKITGKFLVLHGGSGTSAADFRTAISLGINKININTEVRLAFEKALMKGLAGRTDDIPYHYLANVSSAVEEVVKEKMIIFRSDKKA